MNGGGQLHLPGPPGGRLPALDFLALAHRELRRYLLPLATIFAAIALLFLAWGLMNAPTYKSSATVLVEDNSAIAPLMEGRAADVEYASRAVISRELLFSRRVMEDVVRAGGWITGRPDPAEMDGLIKGVIGRTDIEVTQGASGRSSNPGLSLVKITYADSDPDRAYRVAKRFSEALIEQVLDSKARASRTAYQFIDAQVETYETALAAADERLQAYRSAHPDAMPGVEADVASRIAELRRAVDNARMDLADVGAQERQVIGSLSRESQVATVPRASQFNARLAALQAEQDRLLLTYTDKHPDVVLVRKQIQQVRSQAADPGGADMPSTVPGAAPSLNPVYSQIRGQLVDVRRQGAAAASRVATAQALLAEELERNRRILEDQGEVAALTRAHDVNREMYEDLLKRRENARVSMTLDADGRSLGFQIQEPASVPLAPSGVRFVHFAAAGLLFATLVPILLLALVVRHDPRARSATQIEREAGLPVIASIPSHASHGAAMRSARRFHVATLLLVAVPVVYALAMVLKLVDVL